MSPREDEEAKTVKVVDRRRLDESGDERPEEAAAPAAEPARAADPDPAPDLHRHDEKESESLPPLIDFAAFIQSLAQQALMHLGVLPLPETGERQRDLGLARQTIDILNMMHEKTRGNLTADEKRLFEAILHDLRLVFVQVSQERS
ncbi:MAG: DUF1844 domain-containing protein [Pseudomonadota bacterium]